MRLNREANSTASNLRPRAWLKQRWKFFRQRLPPYLQPLASFGWNTTLKPRFVIRTSPRSLSRLIRLRASGRAFIHEPPRRVMMRDWLSRLIGVSVHSQRLPVKWWSPKRDGGALSTGAVPSQGSARFTRTQGQGQCSQERTSCPATFTIAGTGSKLSPHSKSSLPLLHDPSRSSGVVPGSLRKPAALLHSSSVGSR